MVFALGLLGHWRHDNSYMYTWTDLGMASFPSLPAPEQKDACTGRAWYLFSRDHDEIKIGPDF